MQARSAGKRVCKRASLISAWESISNYASSRRNSGIKVRSITCECPPADDLNKTVFEGHASRALTLIKYHTTL
jgi:hypothetical protein